MNATIEKVIECVHNELDWEAYNQTYVKENINCFAHAIGSTVTSADKYYRLGMLSGEKPDNQNYFSDNEVKSLFLEDAQVLDLKVEEITFLDKANPTKEVNLKRNQHIVALFVEESSSGEIWDFHFLRYDKEKGWTEKRYRRPVVFLTNIFASWPECWNCKLLGTFRITR